MSENKPYDHFKNLFNEGKLKFPPSEEMEKMLVMPSRFSDWLRHDTERRIFYVAADPAVEIPERNVRFSSFIEEDKAYIIDKTATFFKPPSLEMSAAMQAFEQQIENLFFRLGGIPAEYFTKKPIITWLRREDESFTAWGTRLFDQGLLDDPEIRWAYQKALAGEGIGLVTQFVITIRGQIYRVLHISQ